MAGLGTRLFVTVFMLCLVVIAVAAVTKDSHPRKHKKYDPAAAEESKLASLGFKKNRSPRQTQNERRQYYPCISCFRIGSREICTSPYCPENYQCDRASKRCHKKANVRGKPEEEAAPSQPSPAPPADGEN